MSLRQFLFAAVIALPFFTPGSVQGQDLFEFFNVSEGNWTDDASWADVDGNSSFAPDISFDTGAQIDNGGAAIVDGDAEAAGVNLVSGVIDIRDGGTLTVDTGGINVGDLEVGNNGVVQLSGDGSLQAALNLNSQGTLDVGPNATFQVDGDATIGGTVLVDFTDSGNSTLNVGGAATLAATVSPTFANVTPAFGDSFPFLQAGSLTLDDAAINLPSDVTLPRGLAARITGDGNSAAVTFSNLPILQVDRGSGEAKIMNVVGGPVTMTGYSIHSDLGLLNPDGLAGLGEGWTAANPSETNVAELSLAGEQTLAVDESVSLGNAYHGGAANPREEDVTFQFTTPEGDVLDGFVEYTGPANDLVLTADPDTGEVALSHLSAFLGDVEVTGYSITSESDSLNPDNFSGFTADGEAGWMVANPGADAISELNPTDSTVFSNGTVVSLGNIFSTGGAQDLVFQFTTTDTLFQGTVEYGMIPTGPGPGPGPGIPGDIDGDGTVGFPDFLILSGNFGMAGGAAQGDIDGDGTIGFPDFLILSGNFGQSASVATAAVPEPSSISLLALAGMAVLGVRRRRRS